MPGRAEDLSGNQGLLSDREIAALCSGERPLIEPFVPRQAGKPSYGLGSFGYDIRLGKRFLAPVEGAGGHLDPHGSPGRLFRELEEPRAYELPPGSWVLAESVETFHMPDDLLGLCLGKSSYARCGLLVNATPLEPGWRGKLTLSLVNLSPFPVLLSVGQGIAQVVFLRGRRPSRSYREKEAGGRYQDQPGVTLPG